MAAPKTIRLFAEISVLNEILNDDSKIWKLHQCIDPYSVSIKRHRILRQAIAHLYCLQHPIDVENLSWYLSDYGLLDEVGGYRYLQFIAKFHNPASLISDQAVHPTDNIESAF
jgi:replicative DNA helicase